MDSIASAAIRYGGKRTRELFSEPLDLKFIYRSWLPFNSRDPRSLELKEGMGYEELVMGHGADIRRLARSDSAVHRRIEDRLGLGER